MSAICAYALQTVDFTREGCMTGVNLDTKSLHLAIYKEEV